MVKYQLFNDALTIHFGLPTRNYLLKKCSRVPPTELINLV